MRRASTQGGVNEGWSTSPPIRHRGLESWSRIVDSQSVGSGPEERFVLAAQSVVRSCRGVAAEACAEARG